MKTVFVTGAFGFIGRAVCRALSDDYQVIGFGRNSEKGDGHAILKLEGCITEHDKLCSIFEAHRPFALVHCAGIAHQSLWSKSSGNTYDRINNLAAVKVIQEAVKANPDVHVVFLSSVSVYGEVFKGQAFKEEDECFPKGDYAVSKFRAEENIQDLFRDGRLNKVDILRLAPVYDRHWNFNIAKRVMAPGGRAYVRFGSGRQKISVLARENLSDFILFLMNLRNDRRFYNKINVCDKNAWSFNEIIEVFRASELLPGGPVIDLPLSLVKLATCIGAKAFSRQSELVGSFYNKLKEDLIFDNRKMLALGFEPRFNLKSVYK